MATSHVRQYFISFIYHTNGRCETRKAEYILNSDGAFNNPSSTYTAPNLIPYNINCQKYLWLLHFLLYIKCTPLIQRLPAVNLSRFSVNSRTFKSTSIKLKAALKEPWCVCDLRGNGDLHDSRNDFLLPLRTPVGTLEFCPILIQKLWMQVSFLPLSVKK
jgi:hypothetical protein